MTLPDRLRAGAWPSSARAMRCLLKCSNERDPYLQLLSTREILMSTLSGPPAISWRKAGATAGQYAANLLGHTRAAMIGTMGLLLRKETAIPKPDLSWDRGLQLAPVNLECLVTASQHGAVNTSLLLAHTARRSTRVGFGRDAVLRVASNPGSVIGEKS